jgi:putative SOS response-associated peptidase YedK
MAGLRKSWNDPATRQPLETFTIITTDRNEVVEPLLSHPQTQSFVNVTSGRRLKPHEDRQGNRN